MSGLVIVLTLPVNEEEGHRPYLSQSAYPAKGTTVGGRTDDPRRERTRNAPARHRARANARQCHRGVPRTGVSRTVFRWRQGAWRHSDVIHHSGTAKVSTPFRVWTD